MEANPAAYLETIQEELYQYATFIEWSIKQIEEFRPDVVIVAQVRMKGCSHTPAGFFRASCLGANLPAVSISCVARGTAKPFSSCRIAASWVLTGTFTFAGPLSLCSRVPGRSHPQGTPSSGYCCSFCRCRVAFLPSLHPRSTPAALDDHDPLCVRCFRRGCKSSPWKLPSTTAGSCGAP